MLFEKQIESSLHIGGKFHIQIDLLGYENPENKLYNGKNCELFGIFKDLCDPRFELIINE